MSERTAVVWDPAIEVYDFGPGHPLAPIRNQLAMRLVDEFGLLGHDNVSVIGEVVPANDAELLRVHTPDFMERVRAASLDPGDCQDEFGLGTADVPAFRGMHDAAALVCGATLSAARAVWSGQVQHAVNLSGGLHHAMPNRASGFCVYNDIAVAIADLLDRGATKVAYIDVDVHHGDGVQAAFWDDPRVLTISIHESGRTLFPGTGFANDIGSPGALGSAVNIALPAGTGDAAWLRAFHAVVPELLADFEPDVIVSQQGCDSHVDDPLAHLALTIDGQRRSYAAIHDWAHRYAGGRWVAVGGGGYSWVDVVPRAWTHLVAELTGRPIAPESPLPQGFRDYVLERLRRPTPERMTDGGSAEFVAWERGHNPDDPVDRAINATRTAVYPARGLFSEPLGF